MPPAAERPRVLIADDAPSIVTALAFLLDREGFEVITAADGDAALAQARAAHPDLILLDITMPGPDGFEVCQTLRAEPATANTRIILLTARDRDADRAKGLALGADDYITKPFASRELIARIRELLAP